MDLDSFIGSIHGFDETYESIPETEEIDSLEDLDFDLDF